MGWAVFRLLGEVLGILVGIHKTASTQELDALAERMGAAIVAFKIDMFLALVTRGAARLSRGGSAGASAAAGGAQRRARSRGARKRAEERKRKSLTNLLRTAHYRTVRRVSGISSRKNRYRANLIQMRLLSSKQDRLSN